jgi:hypothetical protein
MPPGEFSHVLCNAGGCELYTENLIGSSASP